MRLGFVTGRIGTFDGDDLVVDAGLGRVIDALADRVDSLKVALSIAPRAWHASTRCERIGRRQVTALPHMPSTVASLRHGAACRRAIAAVEDASDAVVVQLPFAPPWALVPARRPRVYHACADVPAAVRSSRYYTGMTRVAAVSFAEFMHTWQRNLVRAPRAALVANGEALRARLADDGGRSVVSSTLRASEIASVPRSRAADAPFRILFVGYLRPEKGLDVLVAAYERVLAALPQAELVIVGARDLSAGGAADDLSRAIERLAARGRVQLRGELAFGPALFQEYADADVLVLPSRSEGTPRVLVEARAFGCPVVASRVGGVPTSVTDEVDGLLFPVADAPALTAQLLRVARDTALRARLVEGGFARARRSTVDAFADVLVSEAHALLQSSGEKSARKAS